MARSRLADGRDGDRHLLFWCPGCERVHAPRVKAGRPGADTDGTWSWNGSLACPTLSPNVDVNLDAYPRCNSYVRDGVIEFIGGTAHALAGQRHELTPLAGSSS